MQNNIFNILPNEILKMIIYKYLTKGKICECNRYLLDLKIVKPFDKIIKYQYINYNSYEYLKLIKPVRYKLCSLCDEKLDEYCYNYINRIIKNSTRTKNKKSNIYFSTIHISLYDVEDFKTDENLDDEIIRDMITIRCMTIIKGSKNVTHSHFCCNDSGIVFEYYIE